MADDYLTVKVKWERTSRGNSRLTDPDTTIEIVLEDGSVLMVEARRTWWKVEGLQASPPPATPEVVLDGAKVIAALKGEMEKEVRSEVIAQLEPRLREIVDDFRI